jgi:hypothetical protein
MALINQSKPTTSIGNSTKVSVGITWASIATTWATETKTWGLISMLLANITKISSTISNVVRPS